MSVLSQFLPGIKKRQQIFTSSGTFVPSAALLNRGGWVEVLCVGGGGGGSFSSPYKTGGGGGAVVRRIVQVTGNVTVTIGAGGAVGQAGGNTSFGSLVVANGGGAGGQGGGIFGGTSGNGFLSFTPGGSGAGGPSPASAIINGDGYFDGFYAPGGPGIMGYGRGGNGSSNTNIYNINDYGGPPNTGWGGSGNNGGTSGICIVEWYE